VYVNLKIDSWPSNILHVSVNQDYDSQNIIYHMTKIEILGSIRNNLDVVFWIPQTWYM